eukprot:SAG11_NODE_13513_length_651_cov_1.632246_1_plen_165_part_00
MLALADEFSFTRKSAVAMSWEFHLKSRSAFQANELQRILVMTVEILGRQLAAGSFNQALEPSLALALSILSWDFKKATSRQTVMNGFFVTEAEVRESAETQYLKPDPSWRPTVSNPQLMEVFGGSAAGPVATGGGPVPVSGAGGLAAGPVAACSASGISCRPGG